VAIIIESGKFYPTKRLIRAVDPHADIVVAGYQETELDWFRGIVAIRTKALSRLDRKSAVSLR
jgi:hypothetical protein